MRCLGFPPRRVFQNIANISFLCMLKQLQYLWSDIDDISTGHIQAPENRKRLVFVLTFSYTGVSISCIRVERLSLM